MEPPPSTQDRILTIIDSMERIIDKIIISIMIVRSMAFQVFDGMNSKTKLTIMINIIVKITNIEVIILPTILSPTNQRLNRKSICQFLQQILYLHALNGLTIPF